MRRGARRDRVVFAVVCVFKERQEQLPGGRAGGGGAGCSGGAQGRCGAQGIVAPWQSQRSHFDSWPALPRGCNSLGAGVDVPGGRGDFSCAAATRGCRGAGGGGGAVRPRQEPNTRADSARAKAGRRGRGTRDRRGREERADGCRQALERGRIETHLRIVRAGYCRAPCHDAR